MWPLNLTEEDKENWLWWDYYQSRQMQEDYE